MSLVIEKMGKSAYDCLFMSQWVEEFLKIFMQVFFVITFLSLFFFLYVVNVESEIFQDQINLVVDDVFQDIGNKMDIIIPKIAQRPMFQTFSSYINNYHISPQDYDDIRQQNNQVLDQTKNVVVLLGVLLFAVFVGVMTLRFCSEPNKYLLENGVVLVFIGATEYLFLNLVSRKYIAADPNKVKLYMLQKISQFSSYKK